VSDQIPSAEDLLHLRSVAREKRRVSDEALSAVGIAEAALTTAKALSDSTFEEWIGARDELRKAAMLFCSDVATPQEPPSP
jgi:hypothetical protein